MKKEYIRDEGKVRGCSSNIAKMNLFECIYHEVFTWHFFKYAFAGIGEELKEGIVNMWYGLSNIVLLMLFPFTLTIKAVCDIKRARKEVELNK